MKIRYIHLAENPHLKLSAFLGVINMRCLFRTRDNRGHLLLDTDS